jgi:hypothetical protein
MEHCFLMLLETDFWMGSARATNVAASSEGNPPLADGGIIVAHSAGNSEFFNGVLKSDQKQVVRYVCFSAWRWSWSFLALDSSGHENPGEALEVALASTGIRASGII